ncbi:helix-turn-helix domain-containing protein [Acinetobacter junii]|uniref:helix-turn-helix domain-containing protein n=1 Tax=Acinetobacter junii TaxID=40215 RepID=UPI002090D6EC|nr:helix-turn-helix domain-containing protein [Acinetobacter junii]USR74869.1 helix-turn-helix domain-containing protein [Acinetobacter junii]
MKQESLLITTAEAAKLLGMKPQTLRKWAIYENGPIVPKRHGRLLRWNINEILRFSGEIK